MGKLRGPQSQSGRTGEDGKCQQTSHSNRISAIQQRYIKHHVGFFTGRFGYVKPRQYTGQLSRESNVPRKHCLAWDTAR